MRSRICATRRKFRPGARSSKSISRTGCYVNRKFKEAAAEARKAVVLEDRSYAAHGLLGRAMLADSEDSKEAIAQLQRSLELNPDQTDLRFDLVNALRAGQGFSRREHAFAHLEG